MSSRHYNAIMSNPSLYEYKPFDVIMLVVHVVDAGKDNTLGQLVTFFGVAIFDQDTMDIQRGNYSYSQKFIGVIAEMSALRRMYVQGDIVHFEDVYFATITESEELGDCLNFIYTRNRELIKTFNLSGMSWDRLLYSP